MIDDYNEKFKDLYNEYNFENFTHKDAIYVELKITELQIAKNCKSIRDIQNIKTKCTIILNILDKYKY